MKKILLLILTFASIATTTLSAVTTVRGLAIVVDFADHANPYNLADIDSMFNQRSGFNLWYHVGSIREFYTNQTNGAYDLTSQVIRVSVSRTIAEYNATGSSAGYNLALDAIAAANAAYPGGFNGLTVNPSTNQLWCINIIEEGMAQAYTGSLSSSIINNGQTLGIGKYIMGGAVSGNPTVTRIAHEYGHAVFGYRDYYKKNGMLSAIGYCLMNSGSWKLPTAPAGTNLLNYCNPIPLSAPLRNMKGWANIITLDDNIAATYKIKTNDCSKIYKYANYKNAKEYLLIEAKRAVGWYARDWDQGIAIWYVDESGGVTNPSTTDNQVRLIQADGKDELNTPPNYTRNLTDLFKAPSYTTYNGPKSQVFRWKDGSQIGLVLSNISAVADTMTFKVTPRPNTITSSVTTTYAGNLEPRGLVSVATGASQTFKAIPGKGYEVSTLIVDGVIVPGELKSFTDGVFLSYTFSNVVAPHTITASFRKPSVQQELPSPWLRAEIGAFTTASSSGQTSGVFGIQCYGKSFGSTLNYNSFTDDKVNTYYISKNYVSENSHFIYRPITGDFEIKARIDSINIPDFESKVGLMARNTTAQNSQYISILKTTSRGIYSQAQLIVSGNTTIKDGWYDFSTTPPTRSGYNDQTYVNKWVKITRVGDVFTTYYSPDNVTYTVFDTKTIVMGASISVGMCATGATNATPVYGKFSSVLITGETFTVATSVSTPNAGGTIGDGTYITTNNVTVTATAAPGYVFKNWTEYGEVVSLSAIYKFYPTINRKLVANFDVVAGMENPQNNKAFTIYPNPCKEKTTIGLSNDCVGNFTVKIRTIGGSQIASFKYRVAGQQKSVELNLQNIEAGIYLVDIQSEKYQVIKKITVVN